MEVDCFVCGVINCVGDLCEKVVKDSVCVIVFKEWLECFVVELVEVCVVYEDVIKVCEVDS